MSEQNPNDHELSPLEAANLAFSDYRVEPASLVSYTSLGRLLVIGSWEKIADVWGRLPKTLAISVLLIGGLSRDFTERCLMAGRSDDIRIEGFLGAFTVTLEGNAIITNAGVETYAFDLILDLENPPLITTSLPPPGYYAPRQDTEELATTLADLPEMVGDFDKPKFFNHLPDICAHGRSGIPGCEICIKTCATNAITSERGQIRVDPHLCQGCGDCACACPAGAINYTYPSRTDTLNRIRLMLKAYFGRGGENPVFLFHDNEIGSAWLKKHKNGLPQDLLTYEIEALGSIGIDIWLATLAMGAVKVIILKTSTILNDTHENLNRQIQFAREILAGLTIEPARLSIAEAEPVNLGGLAHVTYPLLTELQRAHFAGMEDKRRVIQLAVESLQSARKNTPEWIALSEAAPFGEIVVDPKRCTLCMACVSICPDSALADNPEQPQLKFIEANCVQCGLCRSACPEDAITLVPRYVFDPKHARHPRLLHQDETFACIRCGKPFATASVIAAMTERLKNHPMFQGGKLNHLHMCENCRISEKFDGEQRVNPLLGNE